MSDSNPLHHRAACVVIHRNGLFSAILHAKRQQVEPSNTGTP